MSTLPRSQRALGGVLIMVALLAAGAPAQEHPNLERGALPGKSYDSGGVDSVNLFNGNLMITIPLGQTYRGDGALAYALALH